MTASGEKDFFPFSASLFFCRQLFHPKHCTGDVSSLIFINFFLHLLKMSKFSIVAGGKFGGGKSSVVFTSMFIGILIFFAFCICFGDFRHPGLPGRDALNILSNFLSPWALPEKDAPWIWILDVMAFWCRHQDFSRIS